jgi:two-component sensor histidine kinase
MFRVQSPNAMMGRPIDRGLPDAEKERLLGYARRRDQGDANVPTQYEATFLRDDGETFMGEVIVSDITYKGRPASQYIIMDISERKKAEQELTRYREQLEDLVAERTTELMQTNNQLQEEIIERERAEEELRQHAETQKVLVQEVNHRVKNNLTAIVSMLHMEQDRAEVEGLTSYLPVLHDLVGRIGGLATVHSLLSASGWRPLEVSELCQQVTNASLQSIPFGKRITVEVSPSQVRINSNQAHHLTMIINELTTNTIKYALKDRDAARIGITVRQYDHTLEVVFRDDGPGYPNQIFEPNLILSSLGFELILGITKRSLMGEVNFSNDKGAVATITFPNEIESWEEKE